MDEQASTVVVVGASAGGVEALTTIAAGLPESLDAPVCVVIHVPRDAKSRLAEILSRSGPLPATQVRQSESLTPGHTYVASPDLHLVVEDGRVVAQGDPQEGRRPSIDVLFHSAVRAYGNRTIGVVLSGVSDDGLSGARAINDSGGCVLVQSPEDARFPNLPAQIVSRDHPDRVVPLADLANAITAAVERVSRRSPIGDNEADMTRPLPDENGSASDG